MGISNREDIGTYEGVAYRADVDEAEDGSW